MWDRSGAIVDRTPVSSAIGNSVDVALTSLILGTGFDVAMISAGLAKGVEDSTELTLEELPPADDCSTIAAGVCDMPVDQAVVDPAMVTTDPALLLILQNQ